MKKKKHGYQYFFRLMGIVFPVILLLVMVINIISPNRNFSQKENRVLASRPEISLSHLASGKLARQYETYVNDQFFGRDLWVSLKASADRLLGRTDGNGVYLGKDGYLMEAFQPPSQSRLNATVNSITGFAARHPELRQYALIAPNAVNILSDKLPASAPAQNQNPYLNASKDAMENAGITFIDVRDTLTQHKDEGIYYRTDHHWTTQGAYFAYLKAAEEMNLDTASVSYEKLPVSYSFQGTLSAKSGFRSNEKDEMDVFLPRDSSLSSVVTYVDQQKKSASFYSTEQLKGRDKYALFFDGNHPKVIINTPVEENRTLLVLKDSYANCFIPFLVQHYRTIVMVDPRYYYGDLEELIQVENIQEVLYLYNANTFFSDTSLELALTPQNP
ncbi:DHHW family protein [Ruminococcus sp. 5_1_39BFAA]|uniref:DHHW family protein n=1 Tax=Ruminococcus sp. 5_1_39BFAA TaxID=457412 RepID=UPI0035659734